MSLLSQYYRVVPILTKWKINSEWHYYSFYNILCVLMLILNLMEFVFWHFPNMHIHCIPKLKLLLLLSAVPILQVSTFRCFTISMRTLFFANRSIWLHLLFLLKISSRKFLFSKLGKRECFRPFQLGYIFVLTVESYRGDHLLFKLGKAFSKEAGSALCEVWSVNLRFQLRMVIHSCIM